MSSWKVLCWTKNDVTGAHSALRLPSKEQAEAYASNLFGRWFALERYEVVECDDPVNYTWSDEDGLKAVEKTS